MASDSAFRIAVMNTHPIQYFAPLYRYIHASDDVDMHALYLSDFSLQGGKDEGFGVAVRWDVDLMSGYPSQFVGGRAQHSTSHGFWTYVCPQLWSILRPQRFDALWLHGHGFAANILALLTARLRGIPVFMRAETQLDVETGGMKKRLRRLLMPLLYRQCAQLLAIGSRNRDYYHSLGIADDRIALVPYAVDNQRFADAANISDDERARIRASYGIDDDAPVILFASKLNYRKRAQDLIAAMARLQSDGVTAHLLIVGSGDYEQVLRIQASDLGLQRITFAGFVNQAGLPSVYAASDVFVLPSEKENWGLIVNEVMVAGLPVVTTHEVGCVPDLVHHGDNGYLYQTGDVIELASALTALASDAALRSRMGQRSREIIAHWGYGECLAGIRQAISRVRAGQER
ncbi:MAG: glycosyltransferase family 4 protein [Pseudomonadota bacterium]